MGLYFIQAGQSGAIKIGITNDIDQRLGGLQVSNPETLKLLLWRVDLDENDEMVIHNSCSEYRIRGEWFKAEGKVIEILKKLNNNFSEEEIRRIEKDIFEYQDKPVEEMNEFAKEMHEAFMIGAEERRKNGTEKKFWGEVVIHIVDSLTKEQLGQWYMAMCGQINTFRDKFLIARSLLFRISEKIGK